MKTPEKIVLILLGLGILFKLMMWPLGGMFVALSLLTYTLLLFPGGFYLLSGNIKSEKSALPSALSGIFLANIPMAFLFKIQSWPGGQALIVTGAISSLLILIVIAVMKNRATAELQNFYQSLLKRIIIFAVIAIALSFASLQTMVTLQNLRDPELARLKIQAYEHPEDESYQIKLKQYQDHKDSIRHQNRLAK